MSARDHHFAYRFLLLREKGELQSPAASARRFIAPAIAAVALAMCGMGGLTGCETNSHAHRGGFEAGIVGLSTARPGPVAARDGATC